VPIDRTGQQTRRPDNTANDPCRPKPQNQTTAQREPRLDFHPARTRRRPRSTEISGLAAGWGEWDGRGDCGGMGYAELHLTGCVAPLPGSGSPNEPKPGAKTTRCLVRVRNRRPASHRTSPHTDVAAGGASGTRSPDARKDPAVTKIVSGFSANFAENPLTILNHRRTGQRPMSRSAGHSHLSKVDQDAIAHTSW